MAKNVAVDGWNEWGDKNLPKPIGRGNFIVLSLIGSDKVSRGGGKR